MIKSRDIPVTANSVAQDGENLELLVSRILVVGAVYCANAHSARLLHVVCLLFFGLA